MIKFNDEMLSRVLTAHVNGGLVPGGEFDVGGYPGCLYQVACVIDWFSDLNEVWSSHVDGNKMNWFDHNYNPKWTVETFLKKLAERGIY